MVRSSYVTRSVSWHRWKDIYCAEKLKLVFDVTENRSEGNGNGLKLGNVDAPNDTMAYAPRH